MPFAKRIAKSNDLAQLTGTTKRSTAPGPSTTSARILKLQSKIGNQAVLRAIRDSSLASEPKFQGRNVSPSAGESARRGAGQVASVSDQAMRSADSATVSSAPLVIQRKCACGGAPDATGECEECKKKRKGLVQRQTANGSELGPGRGALLLQPKLAINSPGDGYEREADRVAEAIMGASAHPSATQSVVGTPPRIQRFTVQPTGQPSTAPASVDRTLAHPGSPLEPALREDMEQRFGHDFSHVRIRTGAAAGQSARDVNAHAYTVGQNIVFAAGQFNPTTTAGKKLLAHELTHVVQQTSPPSTAVSTIQRQTASPDAALGIDEQVATSGLIADDTVAVLQPGQMKKSEFLSALRPELCRTAEAAMAGTGRKTADCPYLDFWFGFYSKQDGQYVERAIRKYAPETARATKAKDLIPLIAERVRRGVEDWARTGKVTGVPAALQESAGATQSPGKASSGKGIQFKALDGGARGVTDPQAIQKQLGEGTSLESGAKSRLERAYGRSFAHVRVHADLTAGALSHRLNARAFTVGEHIAFGPGEYRPGSLIGDALIAHELAHVVQQEGAGNVTSQAQMGHGSSYDPFEEDADQSALAATASLWGRAKGVMKGIVQNIKPRLRSGLQLRACRRTVKQCPKGLRWAVVGEPAATGPVCVCAWRCLPPGQGFAVSSGSSGSSGDTITCADKDQFGRCPGDPDFVKVPDDYVIKKQSTIVGVGSHMSPLGEQAACGCLPLDIEGDPTGAESVHAPLLPPGVDVTDVLGPVAEIGAARRAANPRTGVREPSEDKPTVGRSAPMTPPPSHVAEAPGKFPGTKPTEVKPIEVKPIEVKPVEVKPVEVKPVEVKPVEVKPVEVKPVEVKPVDVKPADVKPADVKPADVKPADVKPTEVHPETKGEQSKTTDEAPTDKPGTNAIVVANKSPQQIAVENVSALQAQRSVKQLELEALQKRTHDLRNQIIQAENDRQAASRDYDKVSSGEAKKQAVEKLRDAVARREAAKTALEKTPSDDALAREIKEFDRQIDAQLPAVTPGQGRDPADVAREKAHPIPPPPDQTGKIGKTPAQDVELQKDIAIAQSLGATDIRVNQEQVNAQKVRVGINKPDLQYTLPNGTRVYIEYDTKASGRGAAHEARIKANDPKAKVELKIIG